jgi:hypothetical protein
LSLVQVGPSTKTEFKMHLTAVCQFFVGRRITGCMLAGILLAGVGCVSQHAYDQIKAKHDELVRSLDAERADISELDRHIAELKAANRSEDDAATEFRAAIQRDQQLRRRAGEELTSLQTQVANLVRQSRQLARQVADAKRESRSLTVLVAQYKEEVEEAQSQPEQSAPPEPASMPSATLPPIPQPALAQPPVTQTAPAVAAPNPVSPPQQMAQVTPVTPVKPPGPPRPVQTPPQPVEESWMDMIMGWLSSVWNWIFGLFS